MGEKHWPGMRWIGIDEAGYGPNLGPLVMTAVIAEGSQPTGPSGAAEAECPDLWSDLAHGVARAGSDTNRLWVDDSKVILRGRKGRDMLEATTIALVHASSGRLPTDLVHLLDLLGAGEARETEIELWLPQPPAGRGWPGEPAAALIRRALNGQFLQPPSGTWRFAALRSVVLGPKRFNELLGTYGSKARVHFEAFRELLGMAWQLSLDGKPTSVWSDKHGGRHFYMGPLSEAFPDIWIERGPEGPLRSWYHLKSTGRSLTLSLTPRADQSNGLVALASIVSKTVREFWMDCFNEYWTSRIEGLRPTAGYPVDADRFRRAIEPFALAAELDPDLWWRRK
ncbi:MAG: hypothetical protein U0790_26160 [Isosphaeraceae bacterium]